jgi:molybdenum cofactor guanylyltransferase
MPIPADTPIYGCILAGGKSRRFGGIPKGDFILNGTPIIEQVYRNARGQVREIAICVAQDGAGQGNNLGLQQLNDNFSDKGPMAGIHAAMHWARQQQEAGNDAHSYVATFPCDTPSFPSDLVMRLMAAMIAQNASITLPKHKGRIHTMLGIWSTGLLPELERSITADQLALTRWALDQGAAIVEFDDCQPQDFLNINSPEDAEAYMALLMG